MMDLIVILFFGQIALVVVGMMLIKYGVKKYFNKDINYTKWFTWMYGIFKEGLDNLIKFATKK